MTISKKQLISAVSEDTSFAKVHIESIFDSITSHIEAALSSREEVRIAGFGTFSLKKTAARTGRNPRTGEALSISEKSKPVFKPASDFVAKFN